MRKVSRLVGLQVKNPNFSGSRAARGNKGKLFSIRRKDCLIVVCRMIGKPLKARPIRVHPIDVGRAGALRCKYDPLAVSGERGVVIKTGIWQQRALVGAVRFSDEQRRLGGPDTVNKNPFFRAQNGRDCGRQQRRQQSSS